MNEKLETAIDLIILLGFLGAAIYFCLSDHKEPRQWQHYRECDRHV